MASQRDRRSNSTISDRTSGDQSAFLLQRAQPSRECLIGMTDCDCSCSGFALDALPVMRRRMEGAILAAVQIMAAIPAN